MGGWATRMRPHTYSKPKPLVSVAGKAILEHLIDMFKTMPNPENLEYVFIVGPFLGELQIPAFIQENYPEIRTHYIVQHEMKGQSHAMWLAHEYLHGPMLMVFSDTLIDTDFSFLAQETADAVAWVMPVPDPRRFGVAELGKDNFVTRFIEKPQTTENNLAVVGCYYFKEGKALIAAIEEQFTRNLTLKDEFFLTDAISIMIEHGAKVRIHETATWLDTGTIEATLDTNKILLDKVGSQVGKFTSLNTKIIDPVAIGEGAEISNSTIGPHASIGANCKIENSAITESIIEGGCEIQDSALNRSLIGRQAKVQGRGDGHVIQLNVGDNSEVLLA